jgi:hypothetical protein
MFPLIVDTCQVSDDYTFRFPESYGDKHTEEAIKNGLCRKTTKWVQQDIVRRQTNQNTQQRKQTSLLA